MQRHSCKRFISVCFARIHKNWRSRFNEEYTAVDHFGKQLLIAGYNYWGNEPMYSGITGQEFAADIYLGVVYYQRLRHMVNDKYQVRATGPVDPVTRQPVKVCMTTFIVRLQMLSFCIGSEARRRDSLR